MMQPTRPSFSASTGFLCDYLSQIPLGVQTYQPLQMLFNQEVILQQQQQQQQQNQYLNMCLQQTQQQQQAQSSLIMPPQTSLQPTLSQIPYIFPQTNSDHNQEQSLDSLTAQIAAFLYSRAGNTGLQQPLQFSPHIIQEALQNSQQTSQIPQTFTQELGELNNLLQFQQGTIDAQQNSSIINQLAQIAQNSNDPSFSFASALAAVQASQNSQNCNFSNVIEMPTTASFSSPATFESPSTLHFNQKSNESKSITDSTFLQKQASDTPLLAKPFRRSTFDKLAFSPVDASLARTSSPHSSASRISNSQIHHQPFDPTLCQREQKTLPIIFLHHPSQGDSSKIQKIQECNDELISNNSGVASKGIKKRKKNVISFKTRQLPSQSSDSFTNSSSLTVNMKKTENNNINTSLNDENTKNVTANEVLKCSKTPIFTPLAQSLSKDTNLFNDLLDPLILLLKQSEEQQSSIKASNFSGKIDRKQSSQEQITKKLQITQNSSEIQQNIKLPKESKQDNNTNCKKEDNIIIQKEQIQEPEVPTLSPAISEESQQKQGQQQKIENFQETSKAIPSLKQSSSKENSEMVVEDVIPSSPEPLPLKKKQKRASPCRRVCSREVQDESDLDSGKQELNSVHKDQQQCQDEEEDDDDEEEDEFLPTLKKVKRLKRFSQIVKDRSIPDKLKKKKDKQQSQKKSPTTLLHHKRQYKIQDKDDTQKKKKEVITTKPKSQQIKLKRAVSMKSNSSNSNSSSSDSSDSEINDLKQKENVNISNNERVQNNDAFTNIDSFSEATQSLMNQFEKHYLKTLLPNHSNYEVRVNEFKTFMKNAHKNDEMIGLLLNPKACSFSLSFLDFLRVPALKWIRKNVEKTKQETYIQLIQIFKSEESGIAGLRPRKNRRA